MCTNESIDRSLCFKVSQREHLLIYGYAQANTKVNIKLNVNKFLYVLSSEGDREAEPKPSKESIPHKYLPLTVHRTNLQLPKQQHVADGLS